MRPRVWTTGAIAALVALVVGALCMVLTPYLPWLVKFPAEWALPATRWIDVGLTWFLNLIKPAARLFSAALAHPMGWAQALLLGTPWPLLIALVTALGFYVGGWSLATLGFVGLGFVAASGYWVESMNTLSLVSVSVPLALLLGGGIGILANEVPRVKSAVQTLMDVMQTVPTFAYLTPLLLLFGFGPVVGLIASAIYAAPPMARNMILGLERIETDIKEAAIMSGGSRIQQLFLVELPSASAQIMVGVNQCLMAALSMVIIAAVIGGFNDIGWEVLLTMRKAQFGAALLAGLVIVAFAIVIDRISSRMAHSHVRYGGRMPAVIIAVGALAALLASLYLPHAGQFSLLVPAANWVDGALSAFVRNNGGTLETFKNSAMSLGFFAVAALLGAGLALTGRLAGG